MGRVDDIARRYLLLGLRLERWMPRFVDSYIGPAELAEVVGGEQLIPLASLHDEALALQDLALSLPADDAPQQRRRDWFEAQLRAISALARQAAGEEIDYLDLVEQLFDLRVGTVPDERLADARRRMDDALPGQGSLSERHAAFTAATRVPPRRVLRAVKDSTGRFRAVAQRDFEVPEPEGIDWDVVRDQPWGAEARFRGSGRTLIRINLDLPHEVASIAFLASHEGYPGHHLDHITREQTLVRQAGLGEATLRTMNTPESLLSEGLADVAREVVMSDLELGAELRAIARGVGVSSSLEAAVPVWRARMELGGAIGNAAILLHQRGLPAEQVRDYLLETTVEPRPVVDHLLRTLQDPIGRTYPFTYTDGARIIRAWLEVIGQTTGFARLLAEQHTPSRLVAEAAV